MIIIIHIRVTKSSNSSMSSQSEEEHNLDGTFASVDEIFLNGDAGGNNGKIKENTSNENTSAFIFDFRKEYFSSCKEE